MSVYVKKKKNNEENIADGNLDRLEYIYIYIYIYMSVGI